MGLPISKTFVFLKYPRRTIDKWTEGLTSLKLIPPYPSPPVTMEWWVTAEQFPLLRFFDLRENAEKTKSWRDLFPEQGWIGLSFPNGRIFIYAHSS